MVAILSFIVSLLLLLGTNCLCGYSACWKRLLFAAVISGLHGLGCMMRELSFLQSWWWRIAFLCIVCWAAFGSSISALRRGVVYFLLNMAMDGLLSCIGGGNLGSVLLSTTILWLLCVVGFRSRLGGASYIPVEVAYQGKHMELTAMCDTGNSLWDPITGKPVVILSADAAERLTGLTQLQLCRPVETVSAGFLPGLRLLPYRGIGQANGLLLALRLQDVRIGSWRGSSLVAFAPVVLSSEGGFQALTGGMT